VAFRLLRRGIFGLVQRLAGTDGNPKNVISFTDLIAEQMHLWLLADFGTAFRDYRANAQDVFIHASQAEVAGDCIVCLDWPDDPVRFSCGHIFCRECAWKWLAVQPKCPLCFARVYEQKEIEFADGRTSLAQLGLAI
jgi:hypothetical protein